MGIAFFALALAVGPVLIFGPVFSRIAKLSNGALLALLTGLSLAVLIVAVPDLLELFLNASFRCGAAKDCTGAVYASNDLPPKAKCILWRTNCLGSEIFFSIDEQGFREWAARNGCDVGPPRFDFDINSSLGSTIPETAALTFEKKLNDTGWGYSAKFYRSLQRVEYRYTSH